MTRLRVVVMAAGVALAVPEGAWAQAGPQPFTLDQALQYAAEHYPAVVAALEQVNASAAGVTVARSAYLPRLDSLWQSNRGTANNVFGQLLPQAVLPSLSGPVLPDASGASVWGSAAGAFFSWEPFDLGLRKTAVSAAEAALSRARAGEALTRLDVQGAVGETFLGVVAAERAVEAAQADVSRRDVLAQSARALADAQLRPGADASRADAERAVAQTRLIQSRQMLAIARVSLARVLGVQAGGVTVSGAALTSVVPAQDAAGSAVTHPLVQAAQAAVDLSRAQQDVLAHTDRPRVYLQSSVMARGSGAGRDGQLDGGAAGLGIDRANWVAGVQVVMPNLFDFASLRARKAAAAAATRAEVARQDEAGLLVTSRRQEAAAMVEAARAIAANMPVQLAAAQASESQARARYQAGLATLSEVADAQNLLAQAEYQDQTARVGVWRALLAEAVAQGDLAPFVTLLRASGGGR